MAAFMKPDGHHGPMKIHPAQLGESKLVICPVCQFGYNHVGQAVNIPDPDGYTSNLGVRGGGTCIPFSCEGGHAWTLCLGFDKGMTYAYAVAGHPQVTASVAFVQPTSPTAEVQEPDAAAPPDASSDGGDSP